jgi:hypothetical protein
MQYLTDTDLADERFVPRLDNVIPLTKAKAARVEERCSHRVVGYVMQHPALAKRAIVVDGTVRWFPNDEDFRNMMGWKKHSSGPGAPHEGWPLDESPAPALAVVPAHVAAAPSRPVLTAPPSARLLETTEAALGALARDLGCAFNVDIPHNAGWFVPGKPTAYASAYDAIRGLFASLDAGGTVYRPQPAEAASEPPMVAAPPRKSEPNLEVMQGALF